MKTFTTILMAIILGSFLAITPFQTGFCEDADEGEDCGGTPFVKCKAQFDCKGIESSGILTEDNNNNGEFGVCVERPQ